MRFILILCALLFVGADWLRETQDALKLPEERARVRKQMLEELDVLKPTLTREQYEDATRRIREALSDDKAEREQSLERMGEGLKTDKHEVEIDDAPSYNNIPRVD